jgi:1,4-alpha-glucan branching enzyme
LKTITEQRVWRALSILSERRESHNKDWNDRRLNQKEIDFIYKQIENFTLPANHPNAVMGMRDVIISRLWLTLLDLNEALGGQPINYTYPYERTQ